MDVSDLRHYTPSTCGVREILDRISDKWSLRVIALLGSDTMRFTEIERNVDGISRRMLTATLRGLERDGIISRTIYPVMPPRVDYTLTPLGATLLDAVSGLIDWAGTHRAEISAARAEYDARERSHDEAARRTGPE